VAVLAVGVKSFSTDPPRSKAEKDTLSPKWEHSFEFSGTLKEMVSAPLHLSVRHFTSIKQGARELGELHVSLKGLQGRDTLEFSRLPLKPVATEQKAAKVHLPSISALPAPVLAKKKKAPAGEVDSVVVSPLYARCFIPVAQCMVKLAGGTNATPQLDGYDAKQAALDMIAASDELMYFTVATEGPRLGECCDLPIPLSKLQAMYELGRLPREMQVWPVKEGSSWRSLGTEMDAVAKAEAVARDQRQQAATAIQSLVRAHKEEQVPTAEA